MTTARINVVINTFKTYSENHLNGQVEPISVHLIIKRNDYVKLRKEKDKRLDENILISVQI